MKSRECRVSVWNWPQTRDTLNVPKDAVPQEKMPLPRRDEEVSWQPTAVIIVESSVRRYSNRKDLRKKIFLNKKDQRAIQKPVEIIYRCYRRTNVVKVDRSFLVVWTKFLVSLLNCYSCLFLLNEEKIIRCNKQCRSDERSTLVVNLDYDWRACGGTNRTRWRVWILIWRSSAVNRHKEIDEIESRSIFVIRVQFHAEPTYQVAKIDRLRKIS